MNGSIVGLALAAKESGHKVIAVTSLEHTNRVQPKHPSGKRLSEVADVTIDNLAPYGDSSITLEGGIGVGLEAGLGSQPDPLHPIADPRLERELSGRAPHVRDLVVGAGQSRAIVRLPRRRDRA